MSRGLIPILTVVAAAAVAWTAVASGPDSVEAVHAQLDRQLQGSGKAFRAATTAAASRTQALAFEAAQGGVLVQAMETLSRRALRPDSAALDAATGAVAARAEKRGEGDRAVILALANERGAAESRMGEPARFDVRPLPLAETALGGAGKSGWATLDGRLVRMAAVPVGAAERPAGALVLGYAVDDDFARWLAAETGAGVTLLQGGKVLASSLSPAERSQLAAVAAGAGTEAFSFGPPPDGFSFLGASLPWRGPAVASVRAQAVPIPGADDAKVIFSLDARPALAPLAGVETRGLGFAIAVLVIGLAFTVAGRREAGGARIKELADAAEALVAGDLSVRAPDGLRGATGRVADALNRLFAAKQVEVDLATRTKAAEAAAAKILERQKEAAQAAEPTPPPPAPPPAVEPVTQEAKPVAAPEGERPLAWKGFTGTPGPTVEPPQLGAPWQEPSPGPSIWDRPTQQIAAPEVPAPAADAFSGFPEPGSVATPPEPAYNPEATVVAAVPEALLRATSRAPARPILSSPVAPNDPDEAHFEQVFRDFVATRERCGESIDGLTFDRFAGKLRKNREQLVEKYHCRSVRFTVYVKEGKAALKATPLKD
jgi:hypothetical protein